MLNRRFCAHFSRFVASCSIRQRCTSIRQPPWQINVSYCVRSLNRSTTLSCFESTLHRVSSVLSLTSRNCALVVHSCQGVSTVSTGWSSAVNLLVLVISSWRVLFSQVQPLPAITLSVFSRGFFQRFSHDTSSAPRSVSRVFRRCLFVQPIPCPL